MNKKSFPVKFDAESMFIFTENFNDAKKTCKEWNGKYGTLTIDCSKKKSNNQNDYFRGPLLDEIFKAFRDMGHDDVVTKTDAFWKIKNRFFIKRAEIIDGRPYVEFLSTDNKTWKTIDWENKMDQIRIFFADLGYTLPLPKKKTEPNEE